MLTRPGRSFSPTRNSLKFALDGATGKGELRETQPWTGGCYIAITHLRLWVELHLVSSTHYLLFDSHFQ